MKIAFSGPARLFCLCVLQALAARAETFIVTRSQPLDDIAQKLELSNEAPTRHVIRFRDYSAIGRFHMNTFASDTLVFERESESDSVIRISADTLFSFRWQNGRVVLRGLAFEMASPRSMLIDGKPEAWRRRATNGHLVMEDCIIFGEHVQAPFLSWAAGSDDEDWRVELKRNFFVADTDALDSPLDSLIHLESEGLILHNNCIRLPGLIRLVGRKHISLRYNTVNLARIHLDGAGSGGYAVTHNLFGHPPSAAAPQQFALHFGTFGVFSEQAANDNARFAAWQGFDEPGLTRFAPNSNTVIAPIRPRDELWDWADPSLVLHGYANGAEAANPPYNVMPASDRLVVPVPDTILPLQDDTVVFRFDPSGIPRRFTLALDGPPLIDSGYATELRLLRPGPGLRIGGAFRIQSLELEPPFPSAQEPGFEASVLLALDSMGYQPQSAGVWSHERAVFPNALSGARIFHLAFRGNTPRGFGVRPGSALGARDSLRFGHVREAGQTAVLDDPVDETSARLRNLGANLAYSTTAELEENAGITFGAPPQPGVEPWDTTKVRWWIPAEDTLVAAEPQNGVFLSNYKAVRSLRAQLVEELSLPKGEDSIPFPGGAIFARAAEGYQLYIDSAEVDLPAAFGEPRGQVKVEWRGRGATDSLALLYRGAPDFHEPVLADGPEPVTVPFLTEQGADGAKYLRVDLDSVHNGSRLALAVVYNVIAGIPVAKREIDGLTVNDLTSQTSGKIGFPEFGAGAVGAEPAFANSDFVLGRNIVRYRLPEVSPFSVQLALGPGIAQETLSVLVRSAGEWKPHDITRFLFLNGTLLIYLENQHDAFAVVRRLTPAANFVSANPEVTSSEIFMAVDYNDPDVPAPVNSYRVELVSVDLAGEVQFISSSPTPIGTAINLPRRTNAAYAYRIHYLRPDGLAYGTPGSFLPLAQAALPAQRVLEQAAPPSLYSWNLVSFPYAGTLSGSLDLTAKPDPDSGVVDAFDCYTINTYSGPRGDSTRLDRVADLGALRVAPAEGFLMATTKNIAFLMEDTSSLLPLQPFSFKAQRAGWHFMGNPFAFPLPLAKVRTSHPQGRPAFYVLSTRVPRTKDKTGGEYEWVALEEADKLQPFRGLLVHLDLGEILTFDPLSATSAPKAAALPPDLRLRVEGPGGAAALRYFEKGDGRIQPGFPGLGGLTAVTRDGLSAGEVATLQALREEVVVRSPGSGRATLSLGSRAGSAAETRIFSLMTGEEYAGTGPFSVELVPGDNSFLLLHGRRGFVERESRALRAQLPDRFRLEANHPNPFFRSTRIRFQYPAGLGPCRGAVLSFFSSSGRRLHSLELGSLPAGRHEVEMDNPGWPPGVYIYRLDVSTSRGPFSAQRKMAVGGGP